MARQTITKCDVCGRVKGETNHWFRAAFGTSNEESWFTLLADTPAGAEPGSCSLDLCGYECASKALSQWLEAQNKQPEPPKEGGTNG